jgi:hypothetical protein
VGRKGFFAETGKGLTGFQVIIEKILGVNPKVKSVIRDVESGLKSEQGAILKAAQEGIKFYWVRAALIKATIVIREVRSKGEITFITELYSVGVIGEDSVITQSARSLGIDTKAGPRSIPDSSTVAQEITLVVVIKRY